MQSTKRLVHTKNNRFWSVKQMTPGSLFRTKCKIQVDIWPRNFVWRNHRKNILRSVFDCSEPQLSNGAIIFAVGCNLAPLWPIFQKNDQFFTCFFVKNDIFEVEKIFIDHSLSNKTWHRYPLFRTPPEFFRNFTWRIQDGH